MYGKSEHFEFELEEGIATLTLKGESFTADLLRSLLGALSRLKVDGEVAGLLLTGFAGEAVGGHATPMEAAAYSALGQQTMASLDSLGKPVLAAASGPARGAGLELALACDFIVASPDATFGFPAIAAGELPCFGGTQRLSRAVGKARAKEMIFSGEAVDAEAALRIGLATRVCRDADFLNGCRGLLKGICRQGTLALRMAKEIVDAGQGIDLKTACLMERDAFALCFATLDQREGMGSFLERRPAKFQGR